MIKICYRRNGRGRIVEFAAMGHAEYAPLGQDIVCAAITALFEGAVASILELGGLVLPEVQKLPGHLTLCLADEDYQASPANVLSTLTEGLIISCRAVTRLYKDHVSIKEVNMCITERKLNGQENSV